MFSGVLLEVSGVGQPAVQLGESLQHSRQLGEGGPVARLRGPAGRQDLLSDENKNSLRFCLKAALAKARAT